jgi:hypothetical protein
MKESEDDPEAELYEMEKKERRAQEKLKEKKILNYAKHNMGSTVGLNSLDYLASDRLGERAEQF